MCKDYVNSVQFYLCSATSQQQLPEAALWPLIQIQGAIVQWQPLVSLSKQIVTAVTDDCTSSGLSCSWKAENNFGTRASPGFHLAQLGVVSTYCCTPSHLDTLYWAPGLNLTRPDETHHGCLWSSRARSTACVTLCLSFLAYTLSLCWYKELSLLSHFVQFAEVISFSVTADTTVLFSATQPHTHMHAHTHTWIE